MTFEAWVTLAVIVGVIAVLAREMVQPATAVLGGVIVLLLLGIITPAQAFSGFSSEAPIVIAALLVLGRAVELSGLLEPVVGAILGAIIGVALGIALTRGRGPAECPSPT